MSSSKTAWHRKDRRTARHMSDLIKTIVDVGINRSELSRLVGYQHSNTLNCYVATQHRLPEKRLKEIAQTVRERWETIDLDERCNNLGEISKQLLITQSGIAQEIGVSKQLLNQYISADRAKQIRQLLKSKQQKILKATEFIS